MIYFENMHIKQECTPLHSRQHLRFSQDAAVAYNLASTNMASESAIGTFKYSQQACFCFDVAKVYLLDGTNKGRRSKIFDYTGKHIIMTISKFDNSVQDKIKQVKQ